MILEITHPFFPTLEYSREVAASEASGYLPPLQRGGFLGGLAINALNRPYINSRQF